MKIRTDFVTNSSSYSSAEVIIDNPLLLEILQRYKDLGVFGENEIHFEIGSEKESLNGIVNAAFSFKQDESSRGGHLNSLESVLEGVIDIIDDYDFEEPYDKKLLQQMIDELRGKKEEIFKNYKSVLWEYNKTNNEYDSEGNTPCDYVIYKGVLIYSSDKGEEYKFEEFFANIFPGEIIKRLHKVNGILVPGHWSWND